ncbi:hypothetical protein V6N13_048308 [Hibiscus sabdariffa]|uniref:Uncharacterized protein n=1 Tax=Hibiscus sabdariffa TaxID=183260 RepID=A0ABR2F6V3_9ROSI
MVMTGRVGFESVGTLTTTCLVGFNVDAIAPDAFMAFSLPAIERMMVESRFVISLGSTLEGTGSTDGAMGPIERMMVESDRLHESFQREHSIWDIVLEYGHECYICNGLRVRLIFNNLYSTID